MPLSHNPLALLHACLTTNRIELLTAFQREMVAHAESGEPMDPELVKSLTQAIVNLSTEVYDLRRTVDTVMEANKHIHQALNGVQGHLDAAREVTERGRAGNLPDDYGPADLLASIKADLKDTEREEAA